MLIATNTTDLTWGQDIATTLTLAPHIYLFLFLVGLAVMYFFSITLVAGSAAIVLFGMSALYSAVTGVPYFIDSEIPSAVFLGLHLLVTDPSTSPRTPLGKAIFGVLYGLGVFALYSLLGAIGVPTFYDKLLCVPLLNLSVQRIDRLVHAIQDSGVVSRLSPDWTPARANLVYMTVWVLFFGMMTAVGATMAATVATQSPSGSKSAPKTAPWHASGSSRSSPTTAATTRDGHAMSSAGTTRRAPSSPPTPNVPWATSRRPARCGSRPGASTCSTRRG